jgi:hypothetical protein
MPFVGIGTLPTPFSPASVPLPPETGGRWHTSQGVGGWGGVPIPTRGIHYGTLYMYVLCGYTKKNKIKFSSYIRNSERIGCKVIEDQRPPHICINICAFPHILEDLPHIWLFTRSQLNFLIYEDIFVVNDGERENESKDRRFIGTQDWEFFWLRFWNLLYFFVSYLKIFRFYPKNFFIGPFLGEVRFFRIVLGLRRMKKNFELGQIFLFFIL